MDKAWNRKKLLTPSEQLLREEPSFKEAHDYEIEFVQRDFQQAEH